MAGLHLNYWWSVLLVLYMALVPTACSDGESDTGAGSAKNNIPGEGTVPLPEITSWNPPVLKDPVELAPALDESVTADFDTAVDFLFRGDSPIQIDVDEAALDRKRLGVIRGRVLNLASEPMKDVRVHINGRPEFGHTYSRSDGMFDMVVNAGGYVTVTFHQPNHVTVQRPMRPQWNDYSLTPDVVMTPLESVGIAVDFAQTSQLVIGTNVEDSDGKRQAALFFPQGIRAELVFPDGQREHLGQMVIRPTELTVGDTGLQAMPGPLPTSVAYTYATAFSVDEVIAANARHVEFDRAAYIYVDNFLGFPAGQTTPSAYYDYDLATWVPEDNGRVIAVLDVKQGMAKLDVDGSGSVASEELLKSLDLTPDELSALGKHFRAGDLFWRVPVTHLTPYDYNWPIRLPEDAKVPDMDIPLTDRPVDIECTEDGSIIDAYQQTLMQVLPITGTAHRLHYSSARTSGRRSSIDVALHNGNLPASLRKIAVEVTIRGQRFTRIFSVQDAPRRTTFFWDGTDAYGRAIQGESLARVQLNYLYEGEYGEPAPGARAFGVFEAPTSTAPNAPTRTLLSLHQQWSIPIHRWVVGAHDLGGWSLDIHHRYDRLGRTLIMGNGENHKIDLVRLSSGTLSTGNHLTRITASKASSNPSFEQASAIARDVRLPRATRMLAAEDGSLFVVEKSVYNRDTNRFQEAGIVRVTPDGMVERYAGRGRTLDVSDRSHSHCGKYARPVEPCAGNNGFAIDAEFHTISDITLGIDGALYVLDWVEGRVRRIDKDGTISAVTGDWGASKTDGNLLRGDAALNVTFVKSHLLTATDDGGLFISTENGGIVRILPDGSAHSLHGTKSCQSSTYDEIDCDADGRRLGEVLLSEIRAIESSTDGTLYVLTSTHLYRVRLDGRIETLLLLPAEMQIEFGTINARGDANLGLHIDLHDRVFLFGYTTWPGNQDGRVYLFDEKTRKLTPRMGLLIPAGSQPEPWAPDYHAVEGQDALQAAVAPIHVVAGPDGEVYVLDKLTEAIYRIGDRQTTPSDAEKQHIPSPDGQFIFVFDQDGRHLNTLDAKDRSILYNFGYDLSGKLVAVTDAFENQLTIERDARGNAQAIIAPFGQRTKLEINADALLSTVSNPNNESYAFEYTPLGLMTGWQDPLGRTKTYTFDDAGRVLSATNPLGNRKTLTRTLKNNGYQVVSTSAEGRTQHYQIEWLEDGSAHYAVIDQSGLKRSQLIDAEHQSRQQFPDGTLVSTLFAPDPRFGMRAPYPAQTTLTTPSGLVHETTQTLEATFANPADLTTLKTLTRTQTFSRNRILSTQYVMEPNGATVTTTTPMGRTLVAHLDDQGQPVKLSSPGVLPAELAYDDRGRVISLQQGERKIALDYNAQGYLNAQTDALHRSASFEYDPVGRTIRQTWPDNQSIAFEWDSVGNLTALIPPARDAHNFDYTPTNQVSDYNPPFIHNTATPTNYIYDRDKLLNQITFPHGSSILYHRDTTGRIISMDSPQGTTAYTYDTESGRLITIDGPDGRADFTYDGFLLTETSLPQGNVSHRYGEDFNLVERRINGDNPITFEYDDDGLLTRAGALTIDYNAQNGLLTRSTLGALTTNWSLNAQGEHHAMSASFSGNDRYTYQLQFDNAGRITQNTETIDAVTTTHNYIYDTNGRLTEEHRAGVLVQRFTYDHNGNRTAHFAAAGNLQTLATYDAQDRLVGYGPLTYTYDTNGTLTAVTDTSNNQITTYDYDVFGALRTAKLPTNPTITYTIDPLGRRSARLVNAAFERGWIYKDSLNPIAEIDTTGQILTRFVYGTKSHVPDYMITHTGQTYSILSDPLGSVRLVINTANGQIAQRLDYDAFGRVLTDTNPGFQPFGYAGGLYDHHTKLVRFGARDYDAHTGRWTAKDPIGFAGGDTNLYGYVGQDPVNWIDPSGLLVAAWYNINTGNLIIIDLDSGKQLNIEVESGGKPYGDPIPNGKYEIFERAGREDFYRLDPIDSKPGNDRHELTGRKNFRLHRPGDTTGCIAAKHTNDWREVDKLISNTSTVDSSDNAHPWYAPWRSPQPITKYGTLYVYGN